MIQQIRARLARLTLLQQFMLASLVVLASVMVGIGAWIGAQIESGVVHRTALTTSLYVDSFISEHLQELGSGSVINADHIMMLSHLLSDTALGKQIASFKIWDSQARVLYSTEPQIIGKQFPMEDHLAEAWQGSVTAEISSLDNVENEVERRNNNQLLEVYAPVRLHGSNQIIAVAEFYQRVDGLIVEIAESRERTWLMVGGATLVMYVLLIGFMRRASNTITDQQDELNEQIVLLTNLLAKNRALHQRVRHAAAQTADLNERFLRRISAELHDGPIQDLSLVLLRMDSLLPHLEKVTPNGNGGGTSQDDTVSIVKNSLTHALQEMRAIATGMGLPELNNLTIAETLNRAARSHERRTSTSVTLNLTGLTIQTPLPLKITLYRVVQEALNNAYRHAGGVGQAVKAYVSAGELYLEISDQGPGFDAARETNANGAHLGLPGMRERVESLGGLFRVDGGAGHGTRVVALLPLQVEEMAA